MTDWGFPNYDRHLDPDLYDAPPEPPAVEHVKTFACRGCGHCGAEGEFKWFNGWPWCREPKTCHRQITALFMSKYPEPVTEEDAAEYFQQARR